MQLNESESNNSKGKARARLRARKTQPLDPTDHHLNLAILVRKSAPDATSLGAMDRSSLRFISVLNTSTQAPLHDHKSLTAPIGNIGHGW